MKSAKQIILLQIRILALLMLTTVVTACLINFYMIWSAGRNILTAEEALSIGPDCVLVLGAQVFPSGRLSDMLEDRVLTAIDLYQKGVTDRILMSGDHKTIYYDEVNKMKAYAVDKGVPADDIFMDHAGFSTYESVYRAQTVFLAKKVVIVTQSYHLYRAVFTARALGLEAYGVASDLREYAGMPYNHAREFLARIKDFAYAIIKPLPTYTGDAIPISGSGALTDDGAS